MEKEITALWIRLIDLENKINAPKVDLNAQLDALVKRVSELEQARQVQKVLNSGFMVKPINTPNSKVILQTSDANYTPNPYKKSLWDIFKK